jgi:hypothetical protein
MDSDALTSEGYQVRKIASKADSSPRRRRSSRLLLSRALARRGGLKPRSGGVNLYSAAIYRFHRVLHAWSV